MAVEKKQRQVQGKEESESIRKSRYNSWYEKLQIPLLPPGIREEA